MMRGVMGKRQEANAVAGASIHRGFIDRSLASIAGATAGLREFPMSKQIQPHTISRRKLLFVVGLTAGFAVPAAVLTASDAKAQQPSGQAAPDAPAAPKKKKKSKAAAPSGTAPQNAPPKSQ
jgi:hypothetical protein